MIYTLFRKELLDVIRDRRTLFVSIVLPILVIPLLGAIAGLVAVSAERAAESRVLTVAISDTGQESVLREMLLREGDRLFEDGKLEIRDDLTAAEARRLIEVDSLDIMIQFDPEFDAYRRADLPGSIDFYYKESGPGSRSKRRRAEAVLEAYKGAVEAEAFARLGIDPRVHARPVDVAYRNLASSREFASEIAGRIIPYFFIILSLAGCMHPAMDLTAGEKERGTFETLLTLPATRFQILAGKFVVVVLVGLLPAALMVLGTIGFAGMGGGIGRMVSMLGGMRTYFLLVSLLIPIVALFAASLMTISVYARSYKEAQSYISPLFLVVLAPVIIGLLPNIELTTFTSLVPLLNVSLATKAIVAGKITTTHLALIFGSLSAIALGSLWLCSQVFERESAVFRS